MNQKSYFTWTEDKKYTLAKLALRHEGYKPTDRAHQEKWENILEKLKMRPEFAELEIQPIALKNQFARMQKDVLKAAGISMEGANLSGLPEEPSELFTLLCNMAKEVFDKKVVGKEKKKKQKEKEAAMNITEKMALAQQGCSGDIKKEVTREIDDGGNEGLSSKNSSGRKRGRSFMDDFNANVISLLDEDHEEPEIKQRKLDLEKQKLDLEKQKLELQDKELFQRHMELEEAKTARKQQGEQMMEILKLLVARSRYHHHHHYHYHQQLYQQYDTMD